MKITEKKLRSIVRNVVQEAIGGGLPRAKSVPAAGVDPSAAADELYGMDLGPHWQFSVGGPREIEGKHSGFQGKGIAARFVADRSGKWLGTITITSRSGEEIMISSHSFSDVTEAMNDLHAEVVQELDYVRGHQDDEELQQSVEENEGLSVATYIDLLSAGEGALEGTGAPAGG